MDLYNIYMKITAQQYKKILPAWNYLSLAIEGPKAKLIKTPKTFQKKFEALIKPKKRLKTK